MRVSVRGHLVRVRELDVAKQTLRAHLPIILTPPTSYRCPLAACRLPLAPPSHTFRHFLFCCALFVFLFLFSDCGRYRRKASAIPSCSSCCCYCCCCWLFPDYFCNCCLSCCGYISRICLYVASKLLFFGRDLIEIN